MDVLLEHIIMMDGILTEMLAMLGVHRKRNSWGLDVMWEHTMDVMDGILTDLLKMLVLLGSWGMDAIWEHITTVLDGILTEMLAMLGVHRKRNS